MVLIFHKNQTHLSSFSWWVHQEIDSPNHAHHGYEEINLCDAEIGGDEV